jgi:hypothetical protein
MTGDSEAVPGGACERGITRDNGVAFTESRRRVRNNQ